jgi:hypothetical protein
MFPSWNGRRMGERVNSVANALRENRNTAGVAGDDLDFDAILNVQHYTRADYVGDPQPEVLSVKSTDE